MWEQSDIKAGDPTLVGKRIRSKYWAANEFEVILKVRESDIIMYSQKVFGLSKNDNNWLIWKE